MGRPRISQALGVLALCGILACSVLVDTTGLAGREPLPVKVMSAPDASTSGAGACTASSCAAGARCISSVCVPSEALLAWWTFEQTSPKVIDVSGGGNHGTSTSDQAKQAPGKVGMGIELASTGCVVVPDSPSLRLAGAAALTMMAWTRVSGCADREHDHALILNKEHSYEVGVECTGSGLVLQEAIMTDPAGWSWQGSTVLTRGAWQHVAIAWDGTTVRHYVDGQERDRHAQSGSVIVQDSGLGIGCRDVGGDGSAATVREWIAGTVDEVAVYGRALSGAELRTYYEATR